MNHAATNQRLLFFKIALTAILFGIPSASDAAFRFVDCSDPHFGAGDNAKTDTALLGEIDHLDPKPAFVICTGDIADYGTAPEYEKFAAAFKTLSMPFYIAPGNHDVRWNPLGKEGFTLGTHQKMFRSWDYQHVHFVTLDSTVLLEHWGHISQEQLDWLKNDLEQVGKTKPVVIGFHHPIGRDSVMVDNEQQLMQLVEPYNVVLWLQGHGHANLLWDVNGTPAIMLGALYQGAYITCDVDDEKIIINRRTFKDPKKNAEMLQGTSMPSTREVQWQHVIDVPLKRATRPDIKAGGHTMGEYETVISKVPDGSKVDISNDGGKYTPMTYDPDRYRWAAGNSGGTPGEHNQTIRVTLPDQSAWFYDLQQMGEGLKPRWQTNIGGAVQSRIALSDGKVYAPSMGNDLVCLDANSGKESFRVKTAGPIFSSPDVTGGVVYFGSADHQIYAADASTGSIKWKSETAGAVLAGPAVAKGVVCVGSTDTKIYGLEAASGKIRWTVPGGNMFQSKTATDGTNFFVGGWDNHFRCIDAESGKLKWDLVLGRKQAGVNFSAYAPAITSPTVGGGNVYVDTNDGILHALSVADGSEKWRVDWKRMGYSSPLYHDGKVYAALSDEGKVFCADAKDGTILWQADAGSVIYDSGFCFGGGKVFIATVSGIANAFDAQTGKQAWRYQLPPGHVLATPVADETTVYFGSMNGNVTALPINP